MNSCLGCFIKLFFIGIIIILLTSLLIGMGFIPYQTPKSELPTIQVTSAVDYSQIDWQNASEEKKIEHTSFVARGFIANTDTNKTHEEVTIYFYNCLNNKLSEKDLDTLDATQECWEELK